MKKTRSLCIVFGLAGSIVLPCPAAQTSPTQAGQTLGLPRLKQARPTGSLAALKKDKVTIDALAVADDPGVRSTNQQGVSYVTIDAGKSLTRTIRGGASDVTFVTFFAYASIGTSIEVGGAQMRVGASPRSGHVQFILGSASIPRTAGHELADTVRLEQHGSLSLAPLPVLTVRLDPAAGTWDIFMFDRLLTAGL